MKKIGLIVFTAALLIGLFFASGCGLGGTNNLGGDVRGSGTLKSEPRSVSGFNKVDASGALNVELTVQKDFSVVIEADDNLLQYIKTEVRGDTLKIYTDGKISMQNKASIKISMPEVKGLSISGASTASVSNVKADALDLDASGASKITIDGEAKDLTAEASGASEINAEKLRVENADVEATGASSATISAANELKADASGASSIYYTGEPKNVIPKSSGASSVKKK
ncbi:MAG: head GIN domain-containing protein [Pyrinomonadaceae bacterium]